MTPSPDFNHTRERICCNTWVDIEPKDFTNSLLDKQKNQA